MKQLLLISCLVLGACSFHEKQPIDDTYYKKTQSIAWPEKKVATPKALDTSKVSNSATSVSKTVTTTVSQTTTYTK